MDPKLIKQIANDAGWRVVKKHHKSKFLEFKNMEMRLIIDPKIMSVESILYHPRFKKIGATRLIRQNVDEKLLRLIFNYPRIHTDKGFYIKDGKLQLPKN